MKVSITLLGCFVVGVVLAFFSILPHSVLAFDFGTISNYLLYVLMFFVGVSIGVDESIVQIIKGLPKRALIGPFLTIVGTSVATIIVYYIMSVTGLLKGFDLSLKSTVTVNSALGYYSLSGILLTEAWGAQIGSIALLSNLFRELLTILFGPLISKYFGAHSLIASGGVTVTDTTMPIILKCCGNNAFALTMYSGIVINILVPFILAFLVSI